MLTALTAWACQPGMSTTPAVAPVPRQAVGLAIYVPPEPVIAAVDDPDGRPIGMTLQHGLRDVFEEAGFKLAATPDVAALRVAVAIQRVGLIHADLFIKGAEACGVRVDILRGDTVIASAVPEAPCLSTSAYYGMLPKDAAVALVNTLTHAPALVSLAEALRTPGPPPN